MTDSFDTAPVCLKTEKLMIARSLLFISSYV